MITQEFDLNMIPDSGPVVVHVNQYDEGEGRFIINLLHGDEYYSPVVGAAAIIQGTKPDGRGFDYHASISGHTVTAYVTDQMTIVAGIVRCQVVIKEGDRITGTFVFHMDVQKSALPADTDMSASEYQIVMELIETAEAINQNPPIIGENGNWWVWDTPNKRYRDSGVDASITLRIEDVTMLAPDETPYVTNTGTNTDPIFHLFIPRGKGISSIQKTATAGLVDTYTITYSDGAITTFTVTNGKTAYQSAVDGGYDRTEAEFNGELANFADYADDAKQAAEDAEAWAVGERNGQPVTSTDETYHNNSEWYASQAHNSATMAAGSRDLARDWAVGPSGASGTPSDTNNAEYWAEQAAAAAAASGHTIEDHDGMPYPNRTYLRFMDSVVQDDQENDRTLVYPAILTSYMVTQNDFFAPLLTDNDEPILTDDDYAILAEWKYKYV